MDEIKKKPELFISFITPEEAMNKLTDKTLLVVVDTHKPSLVIDEKLLQRAEKIVVIDHHRRGEEFITPTLACVYGALCIFHFRISYGIIRVSTEK